MDFRTDILPHRDRLYRLALSITMQTAEAEDIVQDVMLRAWERRDEWPSIENIQGWLLQVCKNLALDRRKRQERTSPLPTSPHQQEIAIPTTHTNADGEYALLQRLITELPPPLDDLVRLRDIEGLSYREIATLLHLTEDQVRVYLHRARTKLKEKYERLQSYGL